MTAPRGRCRIAWLRQTLPTEDVQAMDDLLFVLRNLNNYEVADVLTEETGVSIDYQVIQRHRTSRCATCNREAEHEPERTSQETH